MRVGKTRKIFDFGELERASRDLERLGKEILLKSLNIILFF